MLQFLLHFSSVIIVLIYFGLLYVVVGFERVEMLLAQLGIENVYLQLLSAFMIFLGVISLLRFGEYWGTKVIRKITARTKNDIDDLIAAELINIFQPLKYLIAASLAFRSITLPENIMRYSEKIFFILFSLFFLYLLTSIVKIFFDKKMSDAEKLPFVNASILPFLKKIIIVGIWILGIISLASNLGYNITGLIAGVGVLGIGIGLAAQKSIANIFGALTIFLNKPFGVGDYVVLGAHTGTVKDIGLTYITLKDAQGHDVMIPNETIISTSIENQYRREYRRADMSLGLVYETSLEDMKHAVSLVEGYLEAMKLSGKLQYFRVHFDMFGDFSLNILITYFSGTTDYTDFIKEKEMINLEIKKLFEENNLEMAFPTSEMIIKNENSEKSPVKKTRKKSI